MDRFVIVDIGRDYSSISGFYLRCRTTWPCTVVKLLLEQNQRAAARDR